MSNTETTTKKEKPEKKSDTVEVEREILEELYSYFASRLTHPHGRDVYKETRKEHEDGTIKKTRIVAEHIHLSNMVQSYDHMWFHRLGAILGELEYKVVEQ